MVRADAIVDRAIAAGHGLRSAPPRLERIQQHFFSNKVEVDRVGLTVVVIGDRTVVVVVVVVVGTIMILVVGARVVLVTTLVSVVVVVGLTGFTTGVSRTLSALV